MGFPAFTARYAWLVLAAVACSGDVPSDAPPQEVPLGAPALLQIGSADTSYNLGTHLALEGLTGRFRLAGIVSIPGPGYTIEVSGVRQGLNVVVSIATLVLPGGPTGDDLSGRTLDVQWELPRGTYRILVQDDIKALVEGLIEVQ